MLYRKPKMHWNSKSCFPNLSKILSNRAVLSEDRKVYNTPVIWQRILDKFFTNVEEP